MDNLILHTERICGLQVALDFASEFSRFVTLTKLVYRGGELHYHRLYQHIDNRDFSVEEALRVVYQCDRQSIRSAVHTQGSVTSFNPDFAGIKIFDIFEQPRYLDAFESFLKARN
jgi:hypothetical protein